MTRAKLFLLNRLALFIRTLAKEIASLGENISAALQAPTIEGVCLAAEKTQLNEEKSGILAKWSPSEKTSLKHRQRKAFSPDKMTNACATTDICALKTFSVMQLPFVIRKPTTTGLKASVLFFRHVSYPLTF